MKVRFYKFTKRNKSTKQPPNNLTFVEKDVALKEKCSVTHPLLLCQTENVAAYNYIYIPSWNRYYFISEGASVSNMWEIACTEDYLASYKTEIGSTSASILYASGSTKNIVDSRIPVLANVLLGHSSSAVSGMTIYDDSLGDVILGITGNGSFGSYLINPADVNNLLNGIDNFWSTEVQDQLDAFKQFFFGGSAGECLKSAIAIPINCSTSSQIQEEIYLGGYPTNVDGYRILDPVKEFTGSISIPWQSNDWKKVSAYTSIAAYFPFIGLLNIPATEAYNDSSLTYTYSLNVTSGDISLEVKGTTSGRIFAVASGNCAMATAYGNTGIDLTKTTSAVAAGVGSAVAIGAAVITGGASAALTTAIGAGLLKTASDTRDALGGSGAGSGGLGGGSSQGLDKNIHVYVAQKQLTDSQTNYDPLIGKPYMGVATIGSFSGYVQTDGFQFQSVQAYSSEKDIINQLLDSGIYYE